MFLIDLNRMYVKIVNGGRVWSHELSDLEFMVPDNELVHVRRGRQVAVMPLADVHQWLWPFGPFDAHDDVLLLRMSMRLGSDVSRWLAMSGQARCVFHSNILVMSDFAHGLFFSLKE